MSSSLQVIEQTVITCDNQQIKRGSYCKRVKHILKSKENIFHHTCRKELKKKLKKYKLRHDGQEDPEVLDVSKILVSLLKIKSPNQRETSHRIEYCSENELRPKNYLFKMGRRKQILSKTKTDSSEIGFVKNTDCDKVNNGTPKTLSNEKIDRKKSNSEEADENHVDISMTKENKKQTNAFKLLMDSRNKSIGSNSPGKDKVSEECQPEIIEKKNAKVKRTLLLQKMAEAKGSLKKKEMEEYQEKEVQRKMEKRAERLKSLILNYEPKTSSKERKTKTKEKETKKEDQAKIANADVKAVKKNKLHLVDLFQEVETKAIDKTPVTLTSSSIEDKEFLKKLSPSLKKRENMLCYFKKIEKDEETKNPDLDNDNVLIKVKITAKSKKKIKKKKMSLNKEVVINDDLEDTHKLDKVSGITHDHTKEKEVSVNKKENDVNVDNLDINNIGEGMLRPKRNTKRPAKYIDEVLVSSSDEELHIFTPKKKKPSLRHIDTSNVMNNEEIKPKLSSESKKESNTLDANKPKSNIKVTNHDKKVAKLAPIFSAKPQLDAAALEAKQKFLSSGVPEKLKKVIEKQKYAHVFSNTFEPVVHVQQNESSLISGKKEVNFDVVESDDDSVLHVQIKTFFEEKFSLNKTFPNKNSLNNVTQVPTEHNVQVVLQGIKENYPKFPVYRTYRLLKDKCRGQYRDCSYLDLDNSIEVINSMIDLNIDSPDRLNWTDKYKPMSSKEIIGNFETTKELKKWLISWTENDNKTKKYNKSDSDSSDFCYSDTDSKDSMKATNNLLILNGPVGSGKTSIVYAVASELAIKVLEVNASSKRTGKIMLQDLQEATQSHKVNRGKSSSSQEYSQKLQEVIEVEVITKPKKRGRPKKVPEKPKKLESVSSQEGSSQSQVSQDVTRTCMSLILIDDADIVFDQDDGFCPAIVQLVQCSKRPVILITSSMTCPHLQRFIQTAKVLKTRPLLPRMLGTWLDIMCLVENNRWSPGIGAQVLSSFRGDIRKSINYLQFYFPKDNSSTNSTSNQTPDFPKMYGEDETSSMSWSDREVIEDKTNSDCANLKNTHNVSQCILDESNSLLHFQSPMHLFNIWWNVPKLLNTPFGNHYDVKTTDGKHSKEAKKISVLDTLSNTLDTISVAGCFNRHFITNITDSPWLRSEQNSVSEQEHMGRYSKHEIMADEISHELVTGCIVNSQQSLGIDQNNYLELPGIEVNRNRDKMRSRHNNLTDYLNSSASLDRRALALDYWSSCRSICRIEKSKTDTSLKRNNRYCHYLKSLNILCNNDCFDNISKSLCLDKEK